MKLIFSLIIFLSCFNALAKREYQTTKTKTEIKIDGFLNDEGWQVIQPTGEFIQINPVENGKATFPTEVKITYDDQFIYVGAMMYDSAPDSILMQLGDRDESLNADQFRFVIDTYNKRTDAYNFVVYASGVQGDSRFQDWTYNGVWHSAVQILDNGWSCEMKIPYSALRFPNIPEQTWGLQMTREIRRYREGDQWVLTPKGDDNFMRHWGELKGIKNITPPVRLSLTPYLSAAANHYPTGHTFSEDMSMQWSAGMDLKYGINESFTLDMTLLPDFSQVRSDNLVKNLGAFEVRYNENRPFFQEGTELFNNGDFFYSRRIGGTPIHYYDVRDQLADNESIVSNPDKTNLINASKVSGRTENGLGIGVFNAVTNETYAEVSDDEGNKRKIKTSPRINYNITSFEKNFGNNNSMYLINTNVLREGTDYDANVTGTGGEFFLFKNNYSASYDFALTKLSDEEEYGYQYFAGFGKAKGKFKFWVDYEEIGHDFNQNDLAINYATGIQEVTGFIGYREFNPFWKLNWGNYNIDYSLNKRLGEEGINQIWIGNRVSGLLTKSWTYFWAGAFITPTEFLDYFEPRTDGMVFKRPNFTGFDFGFSTDYRKKLALDISVNQLTRHFEDKNNALTVDFSPRYRFSDKLNVITGYTISNSDNEIGFSTFDENDNPIFGKRNITNHTTYITAKYLFKNNVSLSLEGRHYRSIGEYQHYRELLMDGSTSEISTDFDQNFNANYFFMNLVFNYQFAPGSNILIVYKNQINSEDNQISYNYGQNFNQMINQAQDNTISVKLLYFFDYLYLKNLKGKKS